MKEYIKIDHQDGLVYFEGFRVKELCVYKDLFKKYVAQLDVRTQDVKHIQQYVQETEIQINQKINPYISYVWVELREYVTNRRSLNGLMKNKITISKGYEIDEYSDSCAFVYFGWGIELNENIIKFIKNGDKYYIKWTALTDDINYYDKRAKKCTFELLCEIEVKEFNNHYEYTQYRMIRDKI